MATVLNYQYIQCKDLTVNTNPKLALGLGILVRLRPSLRTSKFGNKADEIWPPVIPAC